MKAAQFNHPATVSLLMQAGADLSLKDDKDQTAMDIAKRKKQQEAIHAITG